MFSCCLGFARQTLLDICNSSKALKSNIILILTDIEANQSHKLLKKVFCLFVRPKKMSDRISFGLTKIISCQTECLADVLAVQELYNCQSDRISFGLTQSSSLSDRMYIHDRRHVGIVFHKVLLNEFNWNLIDQRD